MLELKQFSKETQFNPLHTSRKTVRRNGFNNFGVVWKFGHTNYLRNSNLFVKILLIHGCLPEFFLRKNTSVAVNEINLRTAD